MYYGYYYTFSRVHAGKVSPPLTAILSVSHYKLEYSSLLYAWSVVLPSGATRGSHSQKYQLTTPYTGEKMILIKRTIISKLNQGQLCVVLL